VIGIGINVRTRAFPPDIAESATSLALAGAASLDRGALFVELAAALSHRLIELSESAVAHDRRFAARDALQGRSIAVDGAPATALGIATTVRSASAARRNRGAHSRGRRAVRAALGRASSVECRPGERSESNDRRAPGESRRRTRRRGRSSLLGCVLALASLMPMGMVAAVVFP